MPDQACLVIAGLSSEKWSIHLECVLYFFATITELKRVFTGQDCHT
jgi:hypothetical protein